MPDFFLQSEKIHVKIRAGRQFSPSEVKIEN